MLRMSDSMRDALRRFLADRRGATAIEYALIAMLVSVSIIASARTIGTEAGRLYSFISESITEATGQEAGES